MAKASDNQFPKVVLTEQASTPTTPAAGDQKLFIDSADHHLKRVDEADVVVDLEAGGTPDAANVTYTPDDTSDWNGAVDPGNANGALDQLAARTKVLEGESVSAALPSGFKYGLVISNNVSDANNDIDIATGKCRDSSDTYNMVLGLVMTKRLDAGWVSGTNQGGLFSGAKASGTWYHTFLIRKDADASIDAGFDTSVTAANIPAGYTAYRRIGSIKTDNSGNILAFVQVANGFYWSAIVKDLDGAVTNTASLVTLSVPPGVNVWANLLLAGQTGATVALLVTSTYQADILPSVTYNTTPAGHTGATTGNRAVVRALTDTSAQVRIRGAAATQNGALYTHGWEELW